MYNIFGERCSEVEYEDENVTQTANRETIKRDEQLLKRQTRSEKSRSSVRWTKWEWQEKYKDWIWEKREDTTIKNRQHSVKRLNDYE